MKITHCCRHPHRKVQIVRHGFGYCWPCFWVVRLAFELIEAGSSERGVCPECLAPWERVTERKTATPGQRPGYNTATGMRNDGERAGHFVDAESVTTGWRPTCHCCKTCGGTLIDTEGMTADVYKECHDCAPLIKGLS